MCLIQTGTKWRFDIDNESVDSFKQILKYGGDGGQDLESYNQMVKVGEGWVDLEPVFRTICCVAK
jgi:hypothetical protein